MMLEKAVVEKDERPTSSCQGKSETLGVPQKRNEIGWCYPVGEVRKS
jgi:hypothetical protein